MSEARTAVIGVGNILMGDEGIGVRVVEKLNGMDLPPNVDCYDAGTAISNLMPLLDGYDKFVIVDAVEGAGQAGDIYRFKPEDISDDVGGSAEKFSVHEMTLLESLVMEKITGSGPKEVVIIGVEPERIEVDTSLSKTLAAKVPTIVDIVVKEITAEVSP